MEKLKNLFDTRNKKIIAGVISIIVIFGVIGSIYALSSSHDLLAIKNNEITIEYGEKISNDVKKYIDTSKLDDDEEKDVLKNTVIRTNVKNEVITSTNEDGTTTETDAGYPKIGNYVITLTYKDETANINVTVKDSTAPELLVPEQVEIVQGTDLATYDFKSLMTASDLSELSDYTIDYSQIDINTPGEYMAKCSVQDKSENKTEKEFKVIIVFQPAVDDNSEVVTEIQTDPTTGQKKTVVTTRPKTNTNNSSSSSNKNSGSNNTNNSSSNNNSNSGNNSSNNSGNTNNGNNSNNNNNTNTGGGNNSSDSGNSSGGSGGSIQIVVKYTCNDHGGEYDSYEELIAAGHGSCSGWTEYGSLDHIPW
ncbi:hypothetical protein B5E92_13505 [Erysipelatoclostridium sp. An15]|uniref:hypothetical protein n=1 Tax=Erysipelatoclostridium sp. An15 TaxID=1965566 RepID=UPI000B37D28B|nr:hypothetical protein [Erysipelatoclostridium sp. An15]OUQ04012.1 hypothetical protein B5E92_13505 [Erysipelatoclostridium sp. An15]